MCDLKAIGAQKLHFHQEEPVQQRGQREDPMMASNLVLINAEDHKIAFPHHQHYCIHGKMPTSESAMLESAG